MQIGLYFCECGENYVSDIPLNVCYCLNCKREVKREDKPIDTKLSTLTDEQLEHLWRLFGDTPINDRDEIEDEFLKWLSGTDRFEIWKWFDQRHSKGVAFLIGQIET